MAVKIDRFEDLVNVADRNFIVNATEIIENGCIDENPRPKYADGSPAHSRSINQVVRWYDLYIGQYPIMTLRPQAWKAAIKEILWIYQDQTSSLDTLRGKYGVKYWDSWDIGDGTIGQRYGATVNKHYNMSEFIKNLKAHPFDRRHIIDLWQVDDFETPGLKPCAFCTMWNVRKEAMSSAAPRYFLDMTLIQRSGDMCAASGAGGINEIQYCALLLMVARATGYIPGRFCHFVQNEQIYIRHMENVIEMGNRESLGQPILQFNPKSDNFFDFKIDDFSIPGYDEVKSYNKPLKFDLGI